MSHCMFDKLNNGNCVHCYKDGGDKYDCVDFSILDRNNKGQHPEFPKKGDKLIFKGVPEFYHPNFVNMRDDARVLQLGVEYTILKCYVNSSWVTIYLEEFPETMFNLSFFDRAGEL